jgi:hypothetical protein
MWRFPEIEATPTRPGRRHGQPLSAQARPRWPVRLEDLGGSASPPTDIRWIVMPAFRPGEPTRVESLPKAEALFGFAEAARNLHIWSDRALVLMRELIADHLGRDRVGYVGALLFPDEDFRAERGSSRRSQRWRRVVGWGRDAVRRRRRS